MVLFKGFNTLCSPVVTICTASLTFTNSTFCPHSVFMCFVWIWEQTAIISLYSINWLVFITETECVYCAVRTGYLLLRSLVAGLQRQKPGFDSRPVRVTFMLDKVIFGQVFSQYFGFPQSIPFNQCTNYLHLHVALTRRTTVWNLSTFQRAMVKAEVHSRIGHESPEGA